MAGTTVNDDDSVNRQDPSVFEVAGANRTFEILRDAGIKVALNTGFNRTGFNRTITDVILDRLGWTESPLIAATVTRSLGDGLIPT
jgi:hypothetical protein